MARPISSVPAAPTPMTPPPARLADQWFKSKCKNQCGRDHDPKREDGLCLLCGRRADYERTGDPSVFPANGACHTPPGAVEEVMGALCAAFNHARSCHRYVDRRAKTADEESRERATRNFNPDLWKEREGQ